MRKTVFITGASSGIGRATALYFVEQGWNVAATMRNPQKEKDYPSRPFLRLYSLDVTDNKSVVAAINQALKDFGKIDVLVNNAGYSVDGVFEAMDDEVIERQFNTNVFGLMRVTREIIPHMRKAGNGTIIQVSSMGGRLTFPLYSIYHGTKWAVEGFSESLQYELSQFNIKIKIIEPGSIKTEFYGRSRVKVEPINLPVYKKFVEKCEVVSQGSGSSGHSPNVVAKKIFEAAKTNTGGLRYPVGSPAPMLALLRKLIPESWFFEIVKRIYKI